MKKSRLIHVFRTLTKKEIRLLRKWLESPAHNQREDVLTLFEYLVKNDRYLQDKYVVKEKVFGRIYKNETYDDAKMRQVIYFLLKIIEDFLIHQEFFRDDLRKKLTLAKVYRKRKLDTLFEKSIKNVESNYNSQPYRNEEFSLLEYKIQKEKYLFFEMKPKRNIPMNLQEVSNALDKFYLIDKFRQCCLMISHQKVYNTDYDMSIIDQLTNYIETNNVFIKIPALAIYYYIYKLFLGEDFFNKLKDEIKITNNIFPLNELRDIYLMTINYCIGKMNLGEERFVREAFEMFKLGFEKNILAQKDDLFRWTFLNVVIIAFRLKEYLWAEEFIESHKFYITEKYREGFVNYTLARLNFENNNYDAAIKHLNRSEYDDIVISLTAKAMLLKIYYEQEEVDLLDALLESTRTYMQRKKVMGYHKSAFKNLIRYVKKLVRVNPFDKSDVEVLKTEVQEANPLTEKAWLLEQLNKMS